jgi:hypothetical protein
MLSEAGQIANLIRVAAFVIGIIVKSKGLIPRFGMSKVQRPKEDDIKFRLSEKRTDEEYKLDVRLRISIKR